MTEDEISNLLVEGESTYLDWKRDFPPELLKGKSDLSWDKGRGKLLKSLVSLANSHGGPHGFLVYGVEDLTSHREVSGISKSFDDADFQQWAENTFDPPPTFSYSELSLSNSKTVGVFKIERTPDYPHVVQANIGGVLFEGQVWYRRGSKNTVALQPELRRMIRGDVPFKISKLSDPVLKRVEADYRKLGRQTTLPLLNQKDSLLAQGYELAVYPGTRREIWVGAIGDRYQHILLLKPKKPKN